MPKAWLSLFTLFMAVSTANAQRILSVEGYSRIEQTDDMTGAVAKAKVIEQARFDAINAAFGSNISQNHVTTMLTENNKTTTTFYLMGESDLHGTWVRDKEKPRVKKHIVENVIIWEAWVKGEARELIRPKVDFQCQLLANGIDERYLAEELHDGDAFYARFRTPVSGYLMIFIADDHGVVNCLLPTDGEDYCEVPANQWMLFHYNPTVAEEHWIAILPKDRLVEYDQLYAIFSPNKLIPPTRTIDTNNSDLNHYSTRTRQVKHLAKLTFKDFQKYLGRLQRTDTEAQVQKMLIKISKRQ